MYPRGGLVGMDLYLPLPAAQGHFLQGVDCASEDSPRELQQQLLQGYKEQPLSTAQFRVSAVIGRYTDFYQREKRAVNSFQMEVTQLDSPKRHHSINRLEFLRRMLSS